MSEEQRSKTKLRKYDLNPKKTKQMIAICLTHLFNQWCSETCWEWLLHISPGTISWHHLSSLYAGFQHESCIFCGAQHGNLVAQEQHRSPCRRFQSMDHTWDQIYLKTPYVWSLVTQKPLSSCSMYVLERMRLTWYPNQCALEYQNQSNQCRWSSFSRVRIL